MPNFGVCLQKQRGRRMLGKLGQYARASLNVPRMVHVESGGWVAGRAFWRQCSKHGHSRSIAMLEAWEVIQRELMRLFCYCNSMDTHCCRYRKTIIAIRARQKLHDQRPRACARGVSTPCVSWRRHLENGEWMGGASLSHARSIACFKY